MPSPKPVALELSGEERRVLTWGGAPPYYSAGAGTAVEDRVGVRSGPVEHRGGSGPGGNGLAFRFFAGVRGSGARFGG